MNTKQGIGPFAADIVAVREAVRHGRLKVSFHGNNILLKDTRSGEAVKIGELEAESELQKQEKTCENCGNYETKHRCNNCVTAIFADGGHSDPSEWKPKEETP